MTAKALVKVCLHICTCELIMCALYRRGLCLHRPIGVCEWTASSSSYPRTGPLATPRRILTSSHVHTYTHIYLHTYADTQTRQTWKTGALQLAFLRRIPGVDIFHFFPLSLRGIFSCVVFFAHRAWTQLRCV